MNYAPAAAACGGAFVFVFTPGISLEVGLVGGLIAIMIALSQIRMRARLGVAIMAAMSWAAFVTVTALEDTIRSQTTISYTILTGLAMAPAIYYALPGNSDNVA